MTVIKENQTQQRQLLSLMRLSEVEFTKDLSSSVLELTKFDEDPLEYWVFIQSFDNMHGGQVLDDRCQLTQLFSACSGKARKLIECCIAMAPTKGYKRARELLEERFGNEFDLVQN